MKFTITLIVAICLLALTSCASTPKSLKHIDLDTDIVIMYTTDWCHVCDKAKAFLDEHKIEYTEIDYEQEEEYLRLRQIAHQFNYRGTFGAVPVFIVRKHILVGYDPATILWILGGEREGD
jgi:glutaredoxin